MIAVIASLILGAILLVVGFLWAIAVGHTIIGILAAIVLGAGGALIVTAWGFVADKISPTSKKL